MYRCASPDCPGLPWPASESRHPCARSAAEARAAARIVVERQPDETLLMLREGALGTVRGLTTEQLGRLREARVGSDLAPMLAERRAHGAGGRLVVQLDDDGVAHPAPPPRAIPTPRLLASLLALLLVVPARAETPCDAYYTACMRAARAALAVDVRRVGPALAWRVFVSHVATCHQGRDTCRRWDRP